MAAERFATLSQARDQSVDDFANQLSHLALSAFPNLPPPDRDALILHRFITGLSDPNATDILLLHPPPSLSAAIQQCRLYTAYHQERRPKPVPLTVTPRPESRPPARKAHLPVRFPHHKSGCEYCAAFGPDARHCGHNSPLYLKSTLDSEPSPKIRNLRAANGTGIPISGSITLEFVVNDSTLSYHFLVTPVSPWPIVLGLDFLTDNHCTIYTRHRRLVIGSPTSPTVTPIPSDDLDLAYNAVLSAAALEPTRLNDGLPTLSTVGPVAHKQLSDLLASFFDLFFWSTDTLGRTRLRTMSDRPHRARKPNKKYDKRDFVSGDEQSSSSKSESLSESSETIPGCMSSSYVNVFNKWCVSPASDRQKLEDAFENVFKRAHDRQQRKCNKASTSVLQNDTQPAADLDKTPNENL
ncbi:hypothetical protein SprV_0301344500 [Sparganum proliferum]